MREGRRGVFRKKGGCPWRKLRKRGRGRDIVQRDRREREGDPEKGDMEVKIKGWQYNKYKEIKRVRIPGYLKKGWEESRWMRVARFRLGSKIRHAIGRRRRKRGVGYGGRDGVLEARVDCRECRREEERRKQ